MSDHLHRLSIFNLCHPKKSWLRLINKHCSLFVNSKTRDFTISSLNQVMPIISPHSSLLTGAFIIRLFTGTCRFCLLFAISFHCLFILIEGLEIREIPWRKYVQEVEIHLLYPTAPQVCFQKIILELTFTYSTVCYQESQTHGD